MNQIPFLRQLGERAFLLEFEKKISEEVLQIVLTYKNFLQEKLFKQNVEVTNTYNSLLISYPFAIEDVYSSFSELKELILEANIHHNFDSRIFEIPVCYDERFGLDLAEISRVKNLSVEDIIRFHTTAEYRIFFLGFLPGFLYLGGLPDELCFSRRKEPRAEVLKGAVGIGENQTGIYPRKSPGGWNIIGNSPVPLFDPKHDPPCPFSAGDKIKFYSIDFEEHLEISEKVKAGEFHFKIKEDDV